MSGRASEAVDELVRLRGLNAFWSAEAARKVASRWTQDPALLARIR